MFMISRFIFEVAYKEQKLIMIDPYEPQCHINNFYYFRYGGESIDHQVQRAHEPLIIPPHGYKRIWSLESFKLDHRIVAMIGNLSELVIKGLELVYSPSIDPGFEGLLELGLRNNLQIENRLEIHQNIGKILFFDCTDTCIGTEEFVANIVANKAWAIRKEAKEYMQKSHDAWAKNIEAKKQI